MKKSLSVLLAVLLICGFLITTMVFAAGATDNLAEVGMPGDSLWREFSPSDWNRITKLIQDEFIRTSQLRSEMHDGMQYFNYGESTAERVHAWYNGAATADGRETATVGCMVQDFSGGSSTKLLCFDAHLPQWCAIIVTRESFDKGEAYTIRDTIASMYAQAGDIHSDWGLPTSNQYWVVEDGEEILYQRFENGYARSIDGSTMYLKCRFFYTWNEDYDPDFPKTGEDERPSFSEVQVESPELVLIPETHNSCVPPDLPSSEPPPSAEPSSALASEDASEPIALESPMPTASVEEPEPSDETSTGDIFAEVQTTSGTTSTSVRIVRHNTPFMNFLLNYGIFLGVAALIVIGAVTTVIVLSIRKKKAG